MPALDTKTSAPDKNNARGSLPTWLAVTVQMGFTLGFYHGLWQPGLVLIKRDAFRFSLPLKQYLVERLTAGELPQWFPYEALGRPFIGVAHTGVFHPFTALHLLFSVPDAYRASTLISCLLAALGAHALGRALGFSHVGALLAGIAFALSGYVVSLTDNLLYLYSICLLPLFCLALDNALTGGRVWTIAPAVLWATVFLIGDIQTGYYYAFIAVLWLGFRRRVSYRETVLRLALTGGLTVLLAGIQLGPAWSVFTGSERVQSALFHEQAIHWSTHPLRLITILAGPVGEHALPSDPRAEEVFYDVAHERAFGFLYINYFWAESLYMGVPVVGLALLGAWRRRDLRVLALLGGFALLLTLGQFGGLYKMFYQVVPLWSAFRYPEKLMGIVAFAVAMLGGAGLDALRTGHGGPWPWLGAALLFATAGLYLRGDAANAWMATSLAAPAALAREVAASTGQAFLFSALAALGVAMIVVGLTRSAPRRELWLALLAAIIALDLSRANLAAYHTAPVEATTFTPPLVEALQGREGMSTLGRFRVVTLVETLVAMPEQLERALGHYAAAIVARRQALVALHNAEFHIESAKRYLPGYKAKLIALFQQTIGLQAAARYNVAYYIGLRSHLREARLSGVQVAELPGYDLVLFRNPVPVKSRAYVAQHPERTESSVTPAALLRRPDFLNGKVDVIETSDSTLPGPSHDGRAIIERFQPEKVVVRVEASQPAVLILLDAFRVFLPFKQYVLERLSAGELPQWFPYEALGRSFIGVTHTGVFHPFTALYFFRPVPDAYRASTLLSCLLGALGAFALGRTLNFSRSGALVAGIGFTLSGYVVSVTDNIVYLYSICLLPLFCLALEKALVDTRAWLVAPAALWSMVFLIGDVQTGYYYGFIALLWVAARSPRSGYESPLRMVLIGGLTVLLAGIQLGPTWAVFTGSERALPEDFLEQALAWSTHPLRLVTILASPISEHASVGGVEGALLGDLPEKYIGYFWAESLYLGVPVTGLAILGAWWRRAGRRLCCHRTQETGNSFGVAARLSDRNLITLDLPRANLVAYHTAPMEAATFSPPLVEALRAREGALVPGRFRLVTLEENRIVIPEQLERGLGHYAAVIVARHQALDALHGAEFHIESLKRYLTGYKADLVAMLKQRIGLQAAGRLNVAYYIGLRSHLKDPRGALEPVAELADYDLVLFRKPFRIKPRAYLSGRPEHTESPVGLARLFARPDFLNGEVDVIEASDAMLPGPSTEETGMIERYTPEELRVRTETPHAAVLILLDAFDKGWRATLESGAEMPILRANALVRAVIVPEGVHTVTFRYETPLLRVGAAASLVGCTLCLVLLARARWQRQGPPSARP